MSEKSHKVNSYVKKILQAILSKATVVIITTIGQLASCVAEAFKYMNAKRQDKKAREEAQHEKEFSDRVDHVADKGTIKDLIDLTR